MRSSTMAMEIEVDGIKMKEDVTELKNQGNELFKKGDYEGAIELCTKALSLCDDNSTTCILHKNAAASYLKLGKFEDARRSCEKALEISPQDPKALYRRATAFEGLEKYEEAYRDAQMALVSSPSDSATFQPLLLRLHILVEKRREKFSQVKEKASRMMRLAFDGEGSGEEDSETGLNNVLVLCRERAGIEALLELGVLLKLKSLLDMKSPSLKDMTRKVTAVRTLSEIVRFNVNMCKRVLCDLGIPFLINLQDLAVPVKKNKTLVEEVLTAVQYLWQSILDVLCGIKKNDKPDQEMMKENQVVIDSFLTTLAMSITSRSIQAEARDAILQIFIKNIDPKTLLWGEPFVDAGGLVRLVELAGEVPELQAQSAMELTLNTRNLVSVLFSRVYDTMYYDAARKKYTDIIDDYTKELLLGPDIEGKIQVTSIITCLLLGPMDVGNTFIGRPGILQMILVMANSEDYLQQKVASEAIVAAASKKDKAKGIITDGIHILKRLYQSKNDDIKVRALVGMCKLGSTGGTDAAWKPFAEGATLKLTEACRRFLLNPSKDVTIQRWAIEGLSYLTLDAEVKEKLLEDTDAVKALLEISKHASKMGEVLYPIITCIVNLVNAYDKQEIIPELVELAKFAKHHIPEEHEFDDPDFVDKRIEVLVELGVTSCLVNLSKATESENILELIARILNAICEKDNLRGMVTAQGGARELLRISQKATDKGKKLAAQAISRIGISQPPSVAFPGQRSFEVVKPLLSLLDINCPALQNFEALLALCNIAGESEAHRRRILDEQGLSNIECYMYEDHQMLRRAAVQCITNLALSEKVAEKFEGDNDRVKFMMLLCSPPEELGDEDKEEIETMKAAAGVLAIVSDGRKAVCGKILTCVKNSMEILIWLVANPILDIQLRGIAIATNILASDKDLAEQLVGTPVFEVLLALSQSEIKQEIKDTPADLKLRNDVKKRAIEALSYAEKWGLIKKS